MATLSEQIADAEGELATIKAAISSFLAGGNQSVSVGGVSVTKFSYPELTGRRNELEKKLQRLYRGGRGWFVNSAISTGGE